MLYRGGQHGDTGAVAIDRGQCAVTPKRPIRCFVRVKGIIGRCPRTWRWNSCVPVRGHGTASGLGRSYRPFSALPRSGLEAGDSVAMPERIATHFRAVQYPAQSNKTYSCALKDFAESAILAYECGYTEEGLAKDIQTLLDTSTLGGAVQGEERMLENAALGCNNEIVFSNDALEVRSCMEFLTIVWITLMLSHRSVVRWGTEKAISDESLQEWKGFVSMIVTAYFEKRWAWYPIDRLQMEMSLVTGRSERPALVAERARMVYTTLERVAPQFPSM